MADKLVLGGREKVRVAVAQVSPVYLNKNATTQRAVDTIAEAARGGADLVLFPEAWLAGYPYWTEGWDTDLKDWARGRIDLRDSAVLVGDDTCSELSRAARENHIHVVMGCNEIDDDPASSTIYNTLLFFDRSGELYARHRKLMPTFIERVFWGHGDARDVVVHETDIGRLGGLICGEHLMPLLRASMISLGEDIHVAVFPGAFSLHCGPQLESPDVTRSFWGHASVRNHAFEAGAFTLASCAYVDPADVAEDFPFRGRMNISYATGGSSIISPLGVPLVEPTDGATILYADCEAWMIKAVKAIVDAAGHYSRPDVLRLQLRTADGWGPIDASAMPRLRRDDLRRASDRHGVDATHSEEAADTLRVSVG